jgi:hypothetical protein
MEQEEDAIEGVGIDIVKIDTGVENVERTLETREDAHSLEIDIRSQRLSDTYPIRANIYDRTNNFFVRQYRHFTANYIMQPIIHLLFPRVLNNQAIARLLLFSRTTQVKVKSFIANLT